MRAAKSNMSREASSALESVAGALRRPAASSKVLDTLALESKERTCPARGSRFTGAPSRCVGFQRGIRSSTTAFQHVHRVETLGLVLSNPACQRRLGCVSIDTQSVLQIGGEVARKLVAFFG